MAARKSVRFDKTISRGKINQDESIHKEIMVKIYIYLKYYIILNYSSVEYRRLSF